MGSTVMAAAVSLDGFIAYPDDSVGRLFDWYGNGETEYHLGDEERAMRSTPQTAAFMRDHWRPRLWGAGLQPLRPHQPLERPTRWRRTRLRGHS